jgi:hypothetical protein
LHDFEVVLEGQTHRVRAATARDALERFGRDEDLYVVDNDALFQYVVRNLHGAERGNVYRLVGGERPFNPLRVGGYALAAYHPAFDRSGEPHRTRVLVAALEGNHALVVFAEGQHIGREFWVALDGVDPPDEEGANYTLEGYGGSLCDFTANAAQTVEARAALHRARKRT